MQQWGRGSAAGRPLGQAAEEATALGSGFDLAATLGLLLQKSAITALHPSGSLS